MSGSTNKKIRNASPKEYNGIKFRSTLECSCYKKLEQSGLQFEYESESAVLMEGFYLENIVLYAPTRVKGKLSKTLDKQEGKIRAITYTPDFIVNTDTHIIYFDVKGKENDTYPLKKKMFLKQLEKLPTVKKIIFIEPHSVKQMVQAIDFIKKL